MTVKKRGDDAEDHAPRPEAPRSNETPPKPPAEQGAANYQRRRDDAAAIEREDLNSANDE